MLELPALALQQGRKLGWGSWREKYLLEYGEVPLPPALPELCAVFIRLLCFMNSVDFLSSSHLSVDAREENEETLPQRHLLLLRGLLPCLPTHLVKLPGLVAAVVNVCVSPGARISPSPFESP